MLCNSNVVRIVAQKWYPHPTVREMLAKVNIELVVRNEDNVS